MTLLLLILLAETAATEQVHCQLHLFSRLPVQLLSNHIITSCLLICLFYPEYIRSH